MNFIKHMPTEYLENERSFLSSTYKINFSSSGIWKVKDLLGLDNISFGSASDICSSATKFSQRLFYGKSVRYSHLLNTLAVINSVFSERLKP